MPENQRGHLPGSPGTTWGQKSAGYVKTAEDTQGLQSKREGDDAKKRRWTGRWANVNSRSGSVGLWENPIPPRAPESRARFSPVSSLVLCVFLSKYFITLLIKARHHLLMTKSALGLPFLGWGLQWWKERPGGLRSLVRVLSSLGKVSSEPEKHATLPSKVPFLMVHWLSTVASQLSKTEFNSLTHTRLQLSPTT